MRNNGRKDGEMFPVTIQFRDIAESDFIWNAVLSHCEKLDRFYDRIVSCHVTIEAPHRRHNEGTIYHIKVHLNVPGAGIYVNTEPELNRAHEDAYVAIRDAFDATQRKLEDFLRIQRGQVKTPEKPAHAKIAKIFYADGYGFLNTPDNREIYFHQNAIVNKRFTDLSVGDEVRFSEEMGDKGPQVTSMALVGPAAVHLEPSPEGPLGGQT